MGITWQILWQKIKSPLLVIGITIACVLGIALIIGIIGGYLYHWGWTGITTKTLWDWLNLLGVLAIPVVVGFGAVWFTVRHNHDVELAREQHESDQRITLDNQRETVLQTYLDKMSELILHENLLNSEFTDKVRNIARARTLTALSKLDPNRKRSIILFLYESNLINGGEEIIDLSWADLREANLSQLELYDISLEGVYLQGANLSGAFLNGANLVGAKLQGANLSSADLMGASLSGTNLEGTNLRGADLLLADLRRENKVFGGYHDAYLEGADLRGAHLNVAKVTTEQLKQAKSLKGATMPDGSIHL